jgi:hypothetical protein
MVQRARSYIGVHGPQSSRERALVPTIAMPHSSACRGGCCAKVGLNRSGRALLVAALVTPGRPIGGALDKLAGRTDGLQIMRKAAALRRDGDEMWSPGDRETCSS